MADAGGEWVELAVSDGTRMRAFVSRPGERQAQAPGIIVCQEAFGVNGHIRDVATRFARLGYIAIAPDFFHRQGDGIDVPYSDMQTAITHVRAMKDPEIEADQAAAYQWLRDDGVANLPIAAIGFCVGGRMAFLAALNLDIESAVSFYGGGIAGNHESGGLADRAESLRAPMLFFWGGQDQHITPDKARSVIDALRQAKKKYTNVEISDAGHGFFCDMRPAYSRPAALQAWELTLAFLHAQHRGIPARPAL
jgi:carboxymethylenebutenolidase